MVSSNKKTLVSKSPVTNKQTATLQTTAQQVSLQKTAMGLGPTSLAQPAQLSLNDHNTRPLNQTIPALQSTITEQKLSQSAPKLNQSSPLNTALSAAINSQAMQSKAAQSKAIQSKSIGGNTKFESVRVENTPPEQAKQQAAPVSLQKLNSLLQSLQLNSAAVATNKSNNVQSYSLQSNSFQSITVQSSEIAAGEDDMPLSEDDLVAINQLKTLSQRLQQRLPQMAQLTTPSQIAHTIEQFVQFNPLSSSSINLSTLGPLASAIQMILAGRHANTSKKVSPELNKQMLKLLKQSKDNSGLTKALAMLGSLASLKPLEDALTGIAGNIQLYQYQSMENTQNNQLSFYFSIPTREPSIPQVEGEIERQDDEEDGTKVWRLTLLLPVGDTDKIKAMATLRGTNVEIEMSSNNSELVSRAEFYGGFLSQRLESLGISSSKIICQQAELPNSLLKRPNQLIELMA